MKKISIITVILLTLFLVLEAHPEQNTIRLICKYSHTIDAEGKISGTSGEKLKITPADGLQPSLT